MRYSNLIVFLSFTLVGILSTTKKIGIHGASIFAVSVLVSAVFLLSSYIFLLARLTESLKLHSPEAYKRLGGVSKFRGDRVVNPLFVFNSKTVSELDDKSKKYSKELKWTFIYSLFTFVSFIILAILSVP